MCNKKVLSKEKRLSNNNKMKIINNNTIIDTQQQQVSFLNLLPLYRYSWSSSQLHI